MLSKHLAGALLEVSVGRSASFSGGAPLFLALLAENAVSEDNGTTLAAKEVAYGGYQRTEVEAADWAAADGQRITNAQEIALPVRTSGEATVLAWALCTAAVAGEMRHYGETPAFVIDADDPAPRLPVGHLVVAFATPTR